MRINRLDLTRYGRFTDQVFDFGTAQAGKADLHIIYGPNEAGKSTTFSALLDLLFGIEHKSPYNFLHNYSSMKIGASLQLQGGTQELVRIKARANSLQDGDGQTLPDTLITAELGDIDRNAYRMMFSLDDDTLEEGGNAILASKGNLGELLFSASAGLAGLSQKLADLRTKSELFYKPNARSGGLAELKIKLQELDVQKAELDAKSSTQAYAKLSDAHDEALTAYHEALRAHTATRNRMAEIEAMLNALPRLHRLQQVQSQLQAFNDLPELPLGWAEELPQLVVQDVELRTREKTQANTIDALLSDLAEISTDSNALHAAGNCEHLQALRARFLTAEKDLPEREISYRAAQQGLQALLQRLGQPIDTDPQSLLINVQTETQLRNLIESRSGIEAALDLHNKELDAARNRLLLVEDKLAATGFHSDTQQKSGMTVLSELVTRLRQADHAHHLQQAEALVRDETINLQEQLQNLSYIAPWTVENFAKRVEELSTLSVPDPAVIRAVGDNIAKLTVRFEQTAETLQNYYKETVQLEAQLAVLGQKTLLITEEEALNLRKNRDAAWQQHRLSLNEQSAALFEQALAQDDQAVHSRMTATNDLARAFQLRERVAVLKALIMQAEQNQATTQDQLQTATDRLYQHQREILPHYQPDLSADSLLRWLETREQLLQKRGQWLRACRNRDERHEMLEQACQRLSETLSQFGIENSATDFTELLAQAVDLHERFSQMAGLNSQLETCMAEVKRREKDIAETLAEQSHWQDAWQQACQKTWLGQQDRQVGIAEVREVLNLTAELTPLLQRQNDLSERIEKMHQDQRHFEEALVKIAGQLELPLINAAGQKIAALEFNVQIEQRIQQALQQQQKHKELSSRLDQAEEGLRLLQQQMAAMELRKSEMLHYFNAEDLTEVGQKIQAVKDKIRLQEIGDTEAQSIITTLKTVNLADAEAMLDQADSAVLKTELQNLRMQDETEDQRKQEQYRLWKQAEHSLREADNSDNSAAQLEEQRRTLLLEIEESSKNYLRLRFGITAAEQALRLYRDQHRSSMMARASETFAMISQGAYRALTTQTSKDNEILIAIAADGSSKTAEELSKGTRFQLYLALRVAGYYEYIHAERPMPFIADDIMETFDDDRSRETFQIFSQMAGQGQVIYLTHHQHLCDIAREVCPDAQMHALMPR